MSVRIDDNRPFTDAEREWLTRSNLASSYDRIKVNDRRFGHLSEEEKEALREQAASDHMKTLGAIQQAMAQEADAFHPDDEAVVMALDMPNLRMRLESLGITPEGEEMAELQLQLLEHLDDQRRKGA